ncbi:50S ribosomal protein L3 [candidate division WWE3 bacterium RIFCSPHIGHO2_12_FULL_38_15]|uniref:Large ribosomal subunit protein uL3 n=1 Tax=candidate division WWE3 bacterium RIFCSPHIGHO2_02_FULL_38_14 TaxID=1802620 RepID=A0A1F4VB52_UNCKA|nr:MAG: 50S ribosomal protein L3 [candidate division WWE3 bacterium RIFCSPHIGHO2_01_FULL_38_45]OGC49076.1 MAG: 50S ribosomal protein L3 [candidate division WWE3 bacterium RIFCSPHIGHO2_12_FULL_38_15]OGC53531.1 MAG: 50S ribosomal protein L3 [candidate division WWE3 bacterium RIFCSPLOWO2_01_FULL_37_24]OGC54435.1 MAG: 50S ribosomal protein L3 [candidate division WWE3 bacterium RIFCSPHIGHO2_02_FULL_38_14]HLB51680.1 50S ribosomal protein L3 [Patescibacteria group bacterium]
MEQIIKGIKQNMSQIFLESGNVIPVTIIKTESDISEDLLNKSVVLTGKSKGKGFAGVMKRWNFAGVGEATRGQSNKQRSGGSIGSQTPGRVLKGKKMAGRLGNKKVTVKGLRIVEIAIDKKELKVSGPVPGARNSTIFLRIL